MAPATPPLQMQPKLRAAADAEIAAPRQSETAADSVDSELRTWKQERRRGLLLRIPWRQISLMASLCFGIASLVLPDSVNDAVNWLLYLLAAACLYGWFAGRKARLAVHKPKL